MNNKREKFILYETIREIGCYNMITDSSRVIAFIYRIYNVLITRKEYIFILKNYSELKKKYTK
ncbi:hypothetical protein ES705_41946 [subsurface metagenome]